MNCPNCGAPLLNSHKCEYCGTDFNVGNRVSDRMILLSVGDEQITCYISAIEYEDTVTSCFGRMEDGRMMKEPIKRKRTIVLREY